MGCLVALSFTISNFGHVERLILVGPPPSPLPEAASNGSHAGASLARASLARSKGVVDSVVTVGTSTFTKRNPPALIALRISLLGQDLEGYAKPCSALAGATEEFDIRKIDVQTLIVTGDEDKVSPLDMC